MSNILSKLSFGKNEKSQSETLAYYESLLKLYMDAFVVYDYDTKEIIDHNEQLITMFELPHNLNVTSLYFTQLMMRYLCENSLNKETMLDHIPDCWQGEASFMTHTKVKFYTHITSNVVYRGDRKCQVISMRDITETKIAADELIVYKKNVEKAARAKARFLSSMSHELRTPLNGIIGTSNLILTEPQLPDNIKQHINVLKYSSEHMLSIINDILDFSKIDAGKMELKSQSINLKICIENIVKTFEVQFKHKDIPLQFHVDTELDLYVFCDEVKLSQVINNLLSNALKFTHAGSVNLNVYSKTIDNNNISVYFEVKDTGIGIPIEKQSEIFQGFAQVHADDQIRKYGGTGLGLTISERLVRMFGGTLQVMSKEMEGSCFYFTIPFERDCTEKIIITEIPAFNENMADTRGLRILVVEDNEVNAKILVSFLRKWEINIKEAENGIQALELLKFHKFDLVLMDLEMPEMDGYTCIKKIREIDNRIPVLAFTATLLENMDALVKENGFNDYVLKPYRPAELKKKILTFAPHRVVDYA